MLSQWNCFLGSSAWRLELAKLARTLVADGMRFIALLARSRSALAAENLFLRKQLAFYQERKIKPRRFDDITRFMLVLLSHGFAWARCVGKRDTEDLHRLASCGVSPVLALEVTTRATTDTHRTQATDP